MLTLRTNKLSVDIQVTQREGTIFQCFLSHTVYYKSPTHLISVTLFLAILKNSRVFSRHIL